MAFHPEETKVYWICLFCILKIEFIKGGLSKKNNENGKIRKKIYEFHLNISYVWLRGECGH